VFVPSLVALSSQLFVHSQTDFAPACGGSERHLSDCAPRRGNYLQPTATGGESDSLKGSNWNTRRLRWRENAVMLRST